MSHPIIKTACVVAGFAVATLAATSAHAAEPLNLQQKLALGSAMANNQKAKFKVIPKTVAEAEAGTTTSGGMVSSDIPEELHNYLSAAPDTRGNMHVRDIDPSGQSSSTVVEVSNEK